MRSKLFIAPIIALAVASTPAIASGATETPAREEARIPFVNHGGIRDWQAEGNETIYVQDSARRWYKATLMHPATGLPFALAIGFETRGTNAFDRFSSIVVDGRRVPVESLVRVEAPPSKRERKDGNAA